MKYLEIKESTDITHDLALLIIKTRNAHHALLYTGGIHSEKIGAAVVQNLTDFDVYDLPIKEWEKVCKKARKISDKNIMIEDNLIDDVYIWLGEQIKIFDRVIINGHGLDMKKIKELAQNNKKKVKVIR